MSPPSPVAVLLVIACLAAPAAEPAPVATTHDGQRFAAALAQAPAVMAARLRLMAAQRAAGAAGVLPDPMVGLDLGRERMRSGEGMAMYGAMIEQPLPRWGERQAARDAAAAATLMEAAETAEVLGEEAAMLAAAGAERQAAQETIAVLEESRARLAAVRTALAPRLGTGGATIDESLDLDTRDRQLDLDLADARRRVSDAGAEMRARLGLAEDAPLPPVAFPDTAAIAVATSPAAQRAQALRAEALAMEQEASARGRPETAVGVVWEREAVGTMDESDKLSLSLRVSLPVHRSAYAAARAGATHRAAAAQRQHEAALHNARQLIGRARRAIAQAAEARATAEDLDRRTRTASLAVVRQVATGTTSITVALDLLDRIAEARLQAIEAVRAGHQAAAELWRIAPPDVPDTPVPGKDQP